MANFEHNHSSGYPGQTSAAGLMCANVDDEANGGNYSGIDSIGATH